MDSLTNFKKIITDESVKVNNIFSNIINSGLADVYQINSFEFNDDYADRINITTDGGNVEHFKKMMDKRLEELPAVYVFEINKNVRSEDIKSQIIKIAQENEEISTPAMYKDKNHDNNGVLYVGKVTSCAWGRLIQHLGYHKNKKSHGLQLGYWDKDLLAKMELKYTVIFFNPKMREYVQVIESALAKELKPIIGKNKI